MQLHLCAERNSLQGLGLTQKVLESTVLVHYVYLGQLTHVEEVVEFGRCWQHLC